MIFESGPWKADLKRDAAILRRWSALHVQRARRSTLIEKKVFLSAFAIRKLIEARRVSSTLGSQAFPLTISSATSADITSENNHRIDRLYDLAAPQSGSLEVGRLVSVIVHSLIFVEEEDEDGRVIAFHVTSDWDRFKGLYRVELDRFIELLDQVSDDFPPVSIRVRDPKSSGWFVWNGNGEPPPDVLARVNALIAAANKP